MSVTPLHRILFVEDDPDIQVVGRMALELLGGFVVELCASGFEALRLAPSFEPDLILMDVMMPQMDGPTTLQALRALPATDHTPIIFITAKVQPYEIERYYTLGAIGVISKPFDPMTLPTRIHQIWAQAHS